LGLFDFLKSRTKEEKTDSKPVSTARPATDYRALVEMAAIISNRDKDVETCFSELVQNEAAFCEKHAAWCEEMLEFVNPQDRRARLLQIFTYWLTGYDTDAKYGAYIDWKEEPEEIIYSLRRTVERLGYPLDMEDISFGEDEDTFEALKIIDQYLRARGYVLAILDTDSDCYHLYTIPQEGYAKLKELGHSVGFSFYTAE
jgi:peptidoglycan/xylan/chitin deacetylase (PgdA/CDA1 family)